DRTRVKVHGGRHWVGNPTAFAPDSRSLLFMWHGLRVWDVAAGRASQDETIRGRMNPSLVLSRDGRRLFVTHWDPDTQMTCWDLPSRKPVWTVSRTIPDYAIEAAVSDDGALLATGSYDKQVRVWDAATGELRHTLTDHPKITRRLAFAPDGRALAWTADTRVCVWALGEAPARLAQLPGGRCHFMSVAFHPGGGFL